MRVLVTGSVSYDYIMDFPGRFADRIMIDKIHKISLSFLVETLTKQFGGTATNISYTLNLLGVEPEVLASVGNDFGPIAAFLKKNSITTDFIQKYKDVTTSIYFVVTDEEDNQIGSFYVGAQKYARKLSINEIDGVDLAVLAPTDPKAMVKFVKECGLRKLPYFYDPAFQIGTFTPEELREGITGAKILIANDYEIALIEQKLEISHGELIAEVPIVITTLGSRGAIIETRTDSIHITPAKPIAVVDPTGAGDAFRAGFIAGYLRGFDLGVCGQMAAVAAVYTVEKYGTVTHHFTTKDFIKRYKKNFGTMIAL